MHGYMNSYTLMEKGVPSSYSGLVLEAHKLCMIQACLYINYPRCDWKPSVVMVKCSAQYV